MTWKMFILYFVMYIHNLDNNSDDISLKFYKTEKNCTYTLEMHVYNTLYLLNQRKKKKCTGLSCFWCKFVFMLKK